MLVKISEAIETDCWRRDGTKCNAVACMGWRWAEKIPKPMQLPCENRAALVAEDGAAAASSFIPPDFVFTAAKLSGGKNPDGSPIIEAGAYWEEPEDQARRRRRGVCGIVGPVAHD